MQPLDVLYKKGVFKNFTEFTGEHLYRGQFFNKVAGLRHLLKRCCDTIVFL